MAILQPRILSFGGSKSPPVSFLQIWLICMLSIFPRKTSRICWYYIQAMMTLHLMKQIFFKFLFLKLLLFRSCRRWQSTTNMTVRESNSVILITTDTQISMPDRLKIVSCKLVNSFGDHQSYFFTTCDGRQTSCWNDSQSGGRVNVIQTLSNMAVQISESKLNTLLRKRFLAGKVTKRY